MVPADAIAAIALTRSERWRQWAQKQAKLSLIRPAILLRWLRVDGRLRRGPGFTLRKERFRTRGRTRAGAPLMYRSCLIYRYWFRSISGPTPPCRACLTGGQAGCWH